MGINRMAGAPWHVGYLKSGDGVRRHKSRCVYYQKKRCLYRAVYCPGSAQCQYYKEKKKDPMETQAPTGQKDAQRDTEKPVPAADRSAPCHFVIPPHQRFCGIERGKLCDKAACSGYAPRGSIQSINQSCSFYSAGRCRLSYREICNLQRACPDFEKNGSPLPPASLQLP